MSQLMFSEFLIYQITSKKETTNQLDTIQTQKL